MVNDDGKIVKKYIPKENINLIRSLAQKSYNKNLKRFINKRIKILNKLKDFKHDELEKIYDNLSIDRKHLVTPIFPTYKQKLDKWKNSNYKKNEINPEQKIFIQKMGNM